MKASKSGRAFNKNEKILIGVVGLLALGGLLYVFIISPSNKKLEPTISRIKELEEQVNNIDSLQLSIKNKEKELDGLKGQYDEATKSIPKTDRYPQVVKDIEGMATSSGVTITTGTFSRPEIVAKDNNSSSDVNKTNLQTDGLTAFRVSVKINGNYNQCLDFIKNIEKDERILEVTSFTFSEKQEGSLEIIYYVAGGVENEEYDFNSGSYGKSNLFE
ncbi:type 4a pilus biogenesis protein PilO [Clostridium paraputrificum]|uniref:type 4a pilus biogenesis protein PilO n=1 Tax=Clostridium paraputrificum TaxID=29363 RepID=UPI003D3541EB